MYVGCTFCNEIDRNWPNMTEASASTKDCQVKGVPTLHPASALFQQKEGYSDALSSSHLASKLDNFLQNRFFELNMDVRKDEILGPI